MQSQRGFSMIGLMAVVAIVAIIAVVSLPVYNQYIERTKVSKEIPVIGTYKNGIASCFMKDDSLEDCNDGEGGIHPGLDNEGKILSLDVFKGNIVMIIDAQNHMEDVEPVELMYVVNPNVDATFPTLDWTLYCNDYSSDNNALVKECNGLITDKDGDGYEDSVEEEWGSDPLDPDSVPVNWQAIAPTYTDWVNVGGRNYTNDWNPEVSNQTTNFTQTRDYEQPQTRERSDREQDSFSGNIRVINVETETQTVNGQESRNVVVNNTTSGWTDVGGIYGCSDWTPPSDDFYDNQMVDQTRECSQDQENVFTYVVDGNVIETRTETQTNPVYQEQTVSGTNPLFEGIESSISSWTNVGSRNYSGSWSPDVTGQTSNFQQTRPYTQEKERTISERVRNKQTGEIVVTGTSKETDIVSGIGTRTVSVTSTSWQNVGSTFECKNWSPAPSDKPDGQVYTQTGDCLQKQQKTYTYTASGTTIGSMTIDRDQPVTDTRSATGTNPNLVWTSTSPSYGSWQNDGARSYGSWSPAATTQTSDFPQTRSYSQPVERAIYIRERNVVTGAYRTIRTEYESDVDTGTQNRTVYVTSNTVNVGSLNNCSAWSPAIDGQTSNFTQNRLCDQNTQTTYSFNIGGSHTTSGEDRVPDERTVTTNAGGAGWQLTGYENCGSWNKDESDVPEGEPFEKRRTCTGIFETDITYYADGEILETKTIIERRYPEFQTRNSVGTKEDLVWTFSRNTTRSCSLTGSLFSGGCLGDGFGLSPGYFYNGNPEGTTCYTKNQEEYWAYGSERTVGNTVYQDIRYFKCLERGAPSGGGAGSTGPNYATTLTNRCEAGDSVKTNYYMTAPNVSPSGQWEVGPILGAYSPIGGSTPTQASPASYMGDLVYPGTPLVSGGSSYETCIRN